MEQNFWVLENSDGVYEFFEELIDAFIYAQRQLYSWNKTNPRGISDEDLRDSIEEMLSHYDPYQGFWIDDTFYCCPATVHKKGENKINE